MNKNMWELASIDMAVQHAMLPVALLQYMGLLGIFSALLMLSRDAQKLLRSKRLLLGSVMGLSSLLLANLASQFMNTPVKMFLSNDMLFLSGLLGGWVGGAVCLIIVALTRLCLAGPAQFGEALFSFGLMAFGGVVLHRWFVAHGLRRLDAKTLLLILSMRIGAAIAPVQIIEWLQSVDSLANSKILTYRLSNSLFSLPLIVLILAMLRREASYQRAQQGLLNQAFTDPITNLPNRRALANHLDHLLGSSQDNGRAHALILIKVANLKDLIAIHGHDWTDNLLVALVKELAGNSAHLLLSPLRAKLFMFADPTVASILPFTSIDAIEASSLIASLQQQLRDAFNCTPGLAPQLHFCIADMRTGGNTNTTLRNISLALQDSTQTVRYLRQSLIEEAQSNEQIRQQLLSWIRSNTPPLHYQPKFCLNSRTVIGAEALLRARDEQHRPISPLLVLQVAQRHNLLQALEWATIHAVIHDAAGYLLSGLPGPLAVNISAATLSESSFARQLIETLSEHRIPAERLTLELTENSPLPNTELVSHNMLLLKDYGVNLSLDDFGTGYSALSLLAKYPFNEVKIDYSMTSQLHQQRMRTAVSIAQESARLYDARLTAEGIESEEQIEILKDLGILHGQGYVFSRAVPLTDLIRLGQRQQRLDATPAPR